MISFFDESGTGLPELSRNGTTATSI